MRNATQETSAESFRTLSPQKLGNRVLQLCRPAQTAACATGAREEPKKEEHTC